MQQDELRKKIGNALIEQAVKAKKLAKGKDTISDMFWELHPKTYNDFLLLLEPLEKQELIDAIFSEDSELLQQLIAWINDVTLKSLVRVASNSAAICQQLTYDRFKLVLRDLDAENIFKIFNTSTDEQRIDIIQEIVDSQLTGVLTFACQQPEDELTDFLYRIASALQTLETTESFSLEDETENQAEDISLEGETKNGDENISLDDKTENVSAEDDDGGADIYISPEKKKVLQAISTLRLYEQIFILKHKPEGWLDLILGEILKNAKVEEIRNYLTQEETVWVMAKTYSLDYLDEFLKIISGEEIVWTCVSKELQIELLEDMQKDNREIDSIFKIEDLCRLYLEVDRQEREFLLKDVLPVLKVEVNVYREFYAGLQNKNDKLEFLEIMYEEAVITPSIAGKIYQLLMALEPITTHERVYMNSFRNLCPGIDTEEHIDLAK